MAFDGPAGFAALLLILVSRYYKFPVENGQLNDSSFLINRSVELVALVLLTKLLANLFVLTEAHKLVLERFHKFVTLVSVLSLVAAVALPSRGKTGGSLLSTANRVLLLSMVPGALVVKGFVWIGNGNWKKMFKLVKGMWEFVKAHSVCATSMMIVILAAVAVGVFKLGHEVNGAETFWAMIVGVCMFLFALVLPL